MITAYGDVADAMKSVKLGAYDYITKPFDLEFVRDLVKHCLESGEENKKGAVVTTKQNCWEFKKCGREPGGAKVNKLRICPAATEKRTDGIHGGKNGGRTCWAIAGTLCEGKVQGSFAKKLSSCLYCDFYKLVAQEEGPKHQSDEDILKKLKK